MWCKHCEIETNEKNARFAGKNRNGCSYRNLLVRALPGTDYPSSQSVRSVRMPDLRTKDEVYGIWPAPSFPEERLLLELLLKFEPLSLAEKSIWANKNRYYIDGHSKVITAKNYEAADIEQVRKILQEHAQEKYSGAFKRHIQDFLTVNRHHLQAIIDEAHQFIREEASKYPAENIVLSFSGGKDSTVTADIVTKALSNPSLVHILAIQHWNSRQHWHTQSGSVRIIHRPFFRLPRIGNKISWICAK